MLIPRARMRAWSSMRFARQGGYERSLSRNVLYGHAPPSRRTTLRGRTGMRIWICASGTCPFPIPDGQACEADGQRAARAPCNYFSECIAGTCVLFDPGSCK